MSITLERVEKRTDNPTGMSHILDWERGFPYALCGFKGSKLGGFAVETDCVVCNDIWESKFGKDLP